MSDDFEKLTDSVSLYIKEHCNPGLMPPAEVRMTDTKLAVPSVFPRYLPRIRDFQVRPDDVWVISYPKCGTTWTQELVWLLGNDLDYKRAQKELLLQRFPFLEAVAIISDEQRAGSGDDEWVFSADTISYVDELPSPRFIKSHLPVNLLPKQIWEVKPKIIYVTRNPKDVVVSYYHHHRLWNGYTGSYELFVQAFYEDKLCFSPFWDHVVGYKNIENQSNILINSFEEMKKNLEGVIMKTAKFLNKTVTEDKLEILKNHLSFNKMRDNGAINGEELVKEVKQRHGLDPVDPGLHFLRRGEVGSWRNELSYDLSKKLDLWTKNKTTGTVLEGVY